MGKIAKRFLLPAVLIGLGACQTGGLPVPTMGVPMGAAPAASAPEAATPVSSAPMTYRNADRKFHFTIPAGWALTSGDANSDSVVFRKGMTSSHFQFHYTGMAQDFPAEASVKASLKSARDDIRLGKNISAKRRDDKCESSPRSLCARGWELIDSGKGGPQRIIWQVYDKGNYYFNFMASAEQPEFAAAQAELQAIIDSIKFE